MVQISLMTRKIQLENDEIYHVFNRVVDGTNLFKRDIDYERFLAVVYLVNSLPSGKIHLERLGPNPVWSTIEGLVDEDKLVEILAWCLMPTHFHMLLKQLQDDGISLFLKRFQGSHSKYYNKIYKRHGTLFGGPFKAVHIENDIQLTHATRYIHINSLEFFDPMWKERGYVEDKVGAEKFLKEYKWSSLPEYLGTRKDFAQLIDPGQILDYFDNNKEDYWKFIMDWINLDQTGFGPLVQKG